VKRRALVIVLVALAVALSACDGGEGDGSGGSAARGGDSPKTFEPSPDPSGRPIDASGPRVVEPEGGLENVIPTAWTKARVAPDGRSARLTWYSGVEECYGLDHVAVYPTKKMVVVTLFAGSRPEAETCIELAEKVVTIVHFEEPVGDRELVDGALPD
jgi:hypothetical protein